ncbi:MAG: hypothetical protein J4F31_11670 [Flavobacteriales bacterium]|nr:hypothetical protein [Flavobacteriales bacterium]
MAQSARLTDYVILAGEPNSFNFGKGVYLGSFTSISGGDIGTHNTYYDGFGISHPGNVDYSGLPSFPPISNPDSHGSGKIEYNTTIGPGAYGSVKLKNNKTLTFDGPGDYTFRKIDQKGSVAAFVFDIKNQPGEMRLYVHEEVDLKKLEVSIVGGGDASRIILEIHENGDAFEIEGGSCGGGVSSGWKGTIWAPYGEIRFKSSAELEGAMYSGVKVRTEYKGVFTKVWGVFGSVH